MLILGDRIFVVLYVMIIYVKKRNVNEWELEIDFIVMVFYESS